MEKSLIPAPTNELETVHHWKAAGQSADAAVARHVFHLYQRRKSKNTRRRQKIDLASFTDFLSATGLTVGDLYNDPEAWRYVTHGFVQGFVEWLLGQSYAIGSINARLSTIKKYASLAAQAKTLPAEQHGLIALIKGFGHSEGLKEDETRLDNHTATRLGSKKANPVSITLAQAERLLSQPNTPLGRRDALLMCLLLEEGLRIGEVVPLTPENFDLERHELNFKRPKVSRDQRLRISAQTVAAARDYLGFDAPQEGKIWRAGASARNGMADVANGQLSGPGMSERSLTRRVSQLGEKVGLKKLSAHDCRHYWATQAARNHVPLPDLQQAGGWNSVAMPMRYIEKAEVANIHGEEG
jgi:integrase